MGCRAQTNSHGKTSAAPAAEHSSPVRSLPLSPPICLCLLRLDRAFSCVSSQRLEEVGADRRTTSHGPLSTALAVTLSRSPSVSLSLSLSLSVCLSLCLCLPTGGWLRELTRECVEANPGPVYCAEPEEKCQCKVSYDQLMKDQPPQHAKEKCPSCDHLIRNHNEEADVHVLTSSASRGAQRTAEFTAPSSQTHCHPLTPSLSLSLLLSLLLRLCLCRRSSASASLPRPRVLLCVLAAAGGGGRRQTHDMRMAHGRLHWLSHSVALPLSLCLCLCLSVCLSLSLSLSLCLSLSLSPSVCVSVPRSLPLSPTLSVCLSLSVSVCMCVYVCTRASR